MFTPGVVHAVAAVRTISNASYAIIDALAHQTSGNYHQLLLRLRMQIASQPDTHVDLFGTTQLLLSEKTCVDTWAVSYTHLTLPTILRV